MVAVVMFVVLRVTIGWHFLYEGVWKIENADTFSARPFLTQAKGPAAPLFYGMIPDIDGRRRLAIEQVVDGTPIKDAWKQVREDVLKRYAASLLKRKDPGVEAGEEGKGSNGKLLRAFEDQLDNVLWRCEDKLDAYLAQNKETMLAAFARRDEAQKEGQSTELLQQLRQWLSALRGIEGEYDQAVMALAEKHRQENEPRLALTPWLPPTEEGMQVERVVSGLAVQETLRGPDGSPILVVGDGVPGEPYLNAWKILQEDVVHDYQLSEEQKHQAEKTYRRYRDSAAEYLSGNLGDISGYFDSLRRLEERKDAGTNDAAHEKKRIWDRQQKLRAEASVWLSELDRTAKDYQSALWNLLDEDQKAEGPIHAAPSKVDALGIWFFGLKTKMELLDFAVTAGLTAIGACLILGFCTRLAALGGAAFLAFVLLTQPPWPTIYPPAPEVVGHALVVDKNFVEMIGLLLLVTLPVGQWGGLDFFVYRWFGRPFLSRLRRKDQDGQKAHGLAEQEGRRKPEAAGSEAETKRMAAEEEPCVAADDHPSREAEEAAGAETEGTAGAPEEEPPWDGDETPMEADEKSPQGDPT